MVYYGFVGGCAGIISSNSRGYTNHMIVDNGQQWLMMNQYHLLNVNHWWSMMVNGSQWVIIANKNSGCTNYMGQYQSVPIVHVLVQ